MVPNYGDKLQENTILIINFKDGYSPTNQLFKDNKILKFEDLSYWSITLMKNLIENRGPLAFNNFFIDTHQLHEHNTTGALNSLIDMQVQRQLLIGVQC